MIHRKSKDPNLEEINRFLSDVTGERCLFIHNGHVIRNLHELVEELKIIDYEKFNFHVNESKNDFKEWIKEVITDNELAEKISKIRKQKKMVKIIEKRISFLEKLASKKQQSIVELKHEYERDEANNEVKDKAIHRLVHEELVKDLKVYIWIFILGLVVGIIIGMFIETFMNF